MKTTKTQMKMETRGRPRLLPLKEIEEWKNTHGEKYNDPKAIKFVQSLLQRELIKSSEVVAAYLLYESAVSRINACKYNLGIYAKISCDWDDAEVMVLDIIFHKKEMWVEWIKQSIYYEETNKQCFRASIDRIDAQKNYTLSNIQMLSVKDNVIKATARPHYLFNVTGIINPNSDSIQSYRRFESKQEALDSLGIKFKGDTGRLYNVKDQTYLVQSEDVTFGRKEIEEYENDDESTWYSGSMSIGVITDDLGNTYNLNLPITYPQISIRLKPKG
ncbi:hypothetical protein [Paenibacillus odorifer]|nr:hypothetical protein [Paenibacillus odorifer]